MVPTNAYSHDERRGCGCSLAVFLIAMLLIKHCDIVDDSGFKFLFGIFVILTITYIIGNLFNEKKPNSSLGIEDILSPTPTSSQTSATTSTFTPSGRPQIDEKGYIELEKATRQLRTIFWDMTRDKDVLELISGSSAEQGGDRVPDTTYLEYVLHAVFFHDLKHCYKEMGYSYTLTTNTAQEQCLYVIFSIMKGSQLVANTFERYQHGVKAADKSLQEAVTYFQKLRDTRVEVTKADDEFEMMALLSQLDGNNDYTERYQTGFYRLNAAIANMHYTITPREKLWLQALQSMLDIQSDGTVSTSSGAGEQALSQLVGLKEVKQEVSSLSNFISIRKKRQEAGLPLPPVSYHSVFTGNPGTGKTTVARIMANIFKEKGVLKKGHLVETDRSGLVAEYVGQTAPKTNKIIDKAIDGVLFIDEAYSLIQRGDDYGQEAIATLLKRMEDERDRLVVILAGYTEEMETFINSNPGLRSRFNRYFHFEDYSTDELLEIFLIQAHKSEYVVSDEAKKALLKVLTAATASTDKDFGNARYIRNLFETVITRQANRLATLSEINKEKLACIEESDIPA